MKKYIPYFVIVILILILGFVYSTKQKDEKRYNNNLQAMNSDLETYKKRYNDAIHTISIKEALVLTEKEAKDAALLEVKELKALKIKAVKTQAELEAKIEILQDSLKAKPGTIIEYVKDTSGNVGIKLPFEYEYKDKFAYLRSGVKQDKTAYINAEIALDGKIIIGFQRDGLFRTKPVGVFTTENPYIKVNNITPVIIEKNTRWYEKWWVHALGGAIATYTLMRIVK